MNIAIPGGGGFIGGHLIPRLAKKHHISAVVGFDVVTNKLPQVDLVINLASLNSSKESIAAPKTYFDINELGNMRMLEQAQAMGARFMYLTTIKAVEMNPYGASKAGAERWVRVYNETYGLPIILNRVGNLYGPGGDQFFVNHFIRQAVKGDEITVFGDGEDRRTILHIDDLIDLLVDQINNFDKYTDYDEYQISGGLDNSLTVKELLNYIEATNVSYTSELAGQVSRNVMDNNNVTEINGWQPKIDWKTGVSKLVEDYANSD